MKFFKIVFKNLIGYRLYLCKNCGHFFAVPKERISENFVWCVYCGKGELK